VLGICGIDLSGKTEFANSLAEYLASRRLKVMVLHLDDFHNPRAFRNSGSDPVDNYLNRNFNLGLLTKEVLVPIHEKRSFPVDLTLLDLMSDQYSIRKRFSIDRETIVLLEGIFLFRLELASFIDYRVFLEISFEEARRRVSIRDIPIYGPEMMQRYETKYWPAQKKYLAENPPRQTADMVVDNNNWKQPGIIFQR
jgi:uridine kinase